MVFQGFSRASFVRPDTGGPSGHVAETEHPGRLDMPRTKTAAQTQPRRFGKLEAHRRQTSWLRLRKGLSLVIFY